MKTTTFWGLLAGILATACAGPTDAPPASRLRGTQWTLIDFRSPPTGPLTEVRANAYVLQLGADGRASLKLDCNRGTGPWRETQAGSSRGTITIGPIATTRAMCADGGVGERLAAALSGGPASFEIDDGHLTLRTKTAVHTFDVID